ncbi:MAG: dienelactone hydrolase family protein [Sandaracinaceae bacterium]|nr:dienelactone hydrolase family protein [Myxococcales bacterium]MCB9658132.1 dienelactone hydrolase family protein [Sandaracinaceae bacterium]
MHTELLPYTHEDEDFDVFLVRPDGDEPRPAVLICHMWGGREGFIEDKARALAKLGYVAAGIDLYGVGQRGTDVASSRALMTALVTQPAVLRSRLAKAHAVVRDAHGVDPERMGAIGYCFGGLCAILMARMGLPLRGVVSFHGLLKIGEPLDAEVQAQIMVQHGQDDPMVPPSDVGTFAEEMKRINADWQLHSYPGVVHGFTNPKANDPAFGTVYDEDAARRSWIEMRRFFEDTLG